MRARPRLAAILVAGIFAACATKLDRPRSEPAGSLPAHAVIVDYGMWSCERGYLLRDHQCIPEDEASKASRFEIFDPSAASEEVRDEEAPPHRRNQLTSMPKFKWSESDFPPRPLAPGTFSLAPGATTTVIGEPTRYTLAKGQNVYQAARRLGLGVNQIAEAFPDLDLLEPPPESTLDLPTWWVLPESEYRGLVVNVPEMRLYYFPVANPSAVITYPVGLGDDQWRTPTARFKVVEKTVDPTWVIPDSIRAEHVRERGDARGMIPGGDPDNPLGHYRLRLDLPLYGIHGTNVPWGIGMQVTHGCVRLYPEDIQQLFALVPVGTPGELVYRPVKVGARGGEVYVEVHPDIYKTGINYLEEAMSLLAAKGWSERVDWDLLNRALEEKRGVPTRISGSEKGVGSRFPSPKL